MFARVATFEGDQGDLRQVADSIRKDSESGPPEGVPGKELVVLTGLDSGKMVAIVLFDTEDDLRKGDEALNAMSPPPGEQGLARRTGVEMFEVAVHAKV